MADRFELRIQKAICDSYAHHDGWAEKWDNAHKKGRPDLICVLPGLGVHFHEVKHRPELSSTLHHIQNPLTLKQRQIAREMFDAGALVTGILAIGGGTMRGVQIATFPPNADQWHLVNAMWVPYELKRGFDVKKMTRGLHSKGWG